MAYERYYQLVANGRSFAEDIKYHAQSRVREILAKVDEKVASGAMSAEKLKEFYLRLTQKLARCGKLELTREEVNGREARIEYNVTDTCSTVAAKRTLHITMVLEGGWKIQSDELKTDFR